MNNTILRGFCQACEKSIKLSDEGNPFHNESFNLKHHTIVPVWFLSAKQMEIIQSSHEFSADWLNEDEKDWENSASELGKFLLAKPFLVAKILADSEKTK